MGAQAINVATQHNDRWVFSAAGMSDAGKHRRCNEDALIVHTDAALWAVADGMGGHTRGDVASRAITQALADFPAGAALSQAVSCARSRLLEVNHQLWHESQQASDIQLMGSTVVVLIAAGNTCVCLWAGDSRIYRLRHNQLQQLTHDHSIVQRLMDEGSLEPKDAHAHPAASRITRAVGVGEVLELDQRFTDICHGDRFLLCSDGLTLELREAEIAHQLQSAKPTKAVESLLELALARGARDNVTACVVDVNLNQGAMPTDANTTKLNFIDPLTNNHT